MPRLHSRLEYKRDVVVPPDIDAGSSTGSSETIAPAFQRHATDGTNNDIHIAYLESSSRSMSICAPSHTQILLGATSGESESDETSILFN